jgi:large repetitive protein
MTEVEIYEPVLQLTKTVSANLVQEGDIIIFTNRLVHTAASRTSAYSIVFTDTLPAGVVFDTHISPTSGIVAGQTITYNTNHLAALGEFATNDAPIEFVFSVLVTNQLVGSTMTNRSQATYVSLDHPSENGNERDGSDGPGLLNDYVTSAEVPFTSQPIGALTKTFVSSTQTNTLDGATNDWTIGERFIYQIRVDVPQGVVSNLVITDIVPAGIDWVGGNTNAMASAIRAAATSSRFRPDGPQFPTNVADGLFIADPDPTPASSTTTDGSGQPITFTIPAITNAADGNAANDFFLLRMEFVALNMATNVGITPNPRRGSNVVTVADAFTTRGATSPVYRIVAHNMAVRKARTPATADAGDTMTFALYVTNQPTALANAYDLRVTDVLLSNLYDLATFALVDLPEGWGWTNVPVAGGLRFEMFSSNEVALPPASAVTGRFSVALAQEVRPNQIYTNRMDLTTANTLYGDPPGGIAERNLTGNHSVTFNVPGLAIAKTLEATSETNNPPDSTGSNVQIGEVVTYRLALTLPESTITNLTVVDTMTTNGLAYIFGSARLDAATFGGSTGDFTENPSGPGLLSAMGQPMTFAFTNVVVTDDNNTNNNTFFILADYLVLNNATNDGLPPGVTVHTNRATLTYIGNPGAVVTSAVVTTTVIEPRLQIAKSLTPTNAVDAGDILSVTLTVTNSGTATAYDVVIEDRLALPNFDITTLTNVVTPTGFVHVVVGDMFRILSDTNAPTGTNTIEVGESLVFTFDVRTAGSLPPNVVVTNTATVRGDSLASTNIWDVQRFTGDTNSATFTADDFAPGKILVATSETGPADSTGANLQIGEIATYEISVGLPEGTITDLQITDDLPAGMAYVVDSLVVLTNELDGILAPATNVTPNVAPLGASGENVVITFTGDTVMNATTNASGNILRLRLDVVVLDLPANSGRAPQTVLTNRASVTYAGNPNPPATVAGPPVTLIEPDVDIFKTVAPDRGDAGDAITVTLVATNGGLATAYDLLIEDVLDGAVFDTASVTNVSMPDGFTFTLTPGPADVMVSYASDPASGQPTNTLEVGESLSFVFTVHLAQAVEPGGLYTNTVSLETDTIYETNAIGIQRSYTNEAQDSLSVSNMFIAKALTGTSATGPADSLDPNVQIGEIASYRLTLTLPESTITNLTVVDVVPAGMSYVAGSVSVDATGFGGSLPGVPVVTGGVGPGDDITITFEGLTVVSNNNIGADNSFAIEFDLRTLDVGGNTGTVAGAQTVLPNSATIAYDGNPPVHTSGVVNVTVIEPVLGITKTMAAASNSIVVMDLVITNSGLATAFDVEIEDVLTTTWWDTDTITPILVPDGFTFAVAGNPGNATITIASDPASSQPTNSIEAGESLLFRFSAVLIDGAPSPVTNLATITEYSSLDGPDSEEREYDPVDDEDVLAIPGYTLVKTRTSPLGRAAAVGETVTFDLVVANTGGVGLDPVPLEDTYDTTYLSYVSAVPPSEDNVDDGTINWTNVGPLAVGGSVTVAVSFVAIESTWPGETTNFVVASPFTTNGLPLLPKTNEAPVEVVYVGYTLDKVNTTPGPGTSAQVGDPVVFTITIVNTGQVALVTVPVEDTYETTYLSYVSSVPESEDNVDDGTINWTNVGPLAAGATTQIVATFTANASTLSLPRTNVVTTAPTTLPEHPDVPPSTNDAPYRISQAGYC